MMAQTLQDNVKAMMTAGVPEADIAAFIKKYDASQTPSPASLPIKTSTLAPSERSWGDTARSVKDTAAEFLPLAGATIGSIGGLPGRLLGYGAGQGYRELIQRGGEIPGAVADIYRNLRDGDPNVRFAMLKGAAQGSAQGVGNLVPGGRSGQAAVASYQAGRPYTATAEGIGAGLDIATVGAAGAIRKAFTSKPVRTTIGTLLGLGGAEGGKAAADVVADVTGLTPDQRVLAETVASIPGFALGASLAHPAASRVVKDIATHPVTAGVATGGAFLALGDTPSVALGKGISAGSSAALARKYFGQKEAARKSADANRTRLEARQAAQDSARDTAIHERMNEKAANAQTKAELLKAKQEWDAILELASNLTENEKARVRIAAEETVARRESQLSAGLEPGPARVDVTSSRIVNGVKRTTKQTLQEPQSESPSVPTRPVIFDELAQRSTPSRMTPNEIREQLKNRPSLRLIVIAQQLADELLHTPKTDALRAEYSALYRGLTGEPPTKPSEFSPSHVQGKWFASGMNETDKALVKAAVKPSGGRITVTGLEVGN
jgi:hypothetical protein